MRVTMARGTRSFRLAEAPRSRYIQDEQGHLWVVQQTRRVDNGYEVLCRRATRVEQKLYEQERAKADG